jgi:hypothetical protein
VGLGLDRTHQDLAKGTRELYFALYLDISDFPTETNFPLDGWAVMDDEIPDSI